MRSGPFTPAPRVRASGTLLSTHTMKFLRAILYISALASLYSACGEANQSGNVRALAVGAASDVPAPRADGFAPELEVACGPRPTSGGPSELIRYPYLQQVSTRSAQVLWGSKASGSYVVQVNEAGREPVGAFESRIDTTGAVTDGGHQHVAELTGLQPDTVYCYSIRGSRGELLGPTGFKTAPAPGTPFSFLAFGDSGHGGSDQEAVLAQLQQVPADLMVHTGDLAYPRGTLQEFENYFFAMYEPLLASVPLFPTAGNHEYKTKGGQPYRAVFSLPENGGPEGRERWYSFDWGDVHFVALDTERVNQAQAEWLAQDLAQNELPWTVVFLHKSPYTSGARGPSREFRRHFVPMLEAHGVQLVLAGHDHNYERTEKINGVTYVITGGGGRGTRSVGRSSYTAFSQEVLHFLYVSVDGPDLRLYAIDATGQEFDFLHLVNDRVAKNE
jgi:acid phosphatase type 7